jgi:NADH:ubiquinone oxidoreductase subunit 3 (subunit A)
VNVTAAQAVLFVLGAIVAATGFIAVVFLANRLIAPSNPDPEKDSPFECGMDQAGQPWSPPALRFAAIAMLFVLFDAEAILLFAVASRLRGSVSALIAVGAFVLFLGFGLAYAWRKGALEWRM